MATDNKTEKKSKEEFYKELPKLSLKDSMGVAFAIVMLGVIGVAGYIWLTPSLAFSNLVPQRAAVESGAEQVSAMAAAPAEETEPIRCETCGMFYEKSPTQIIAYFNEEGAKKPVGHYFESLGCVFDYMLDEEIPDMPASMEVLDYETFGTDKLVMLDSEEAFYLYDTKRLKGSMAPFIATFKTEKAALAAQKDIGGELKSFIEVHKLMLKEKGIEGAAAHSAGGHGNAAAADGDVYICPCSGDCCDDIVSDKPGECPRCGMTLELKK